MLQFFQKGVLGAIFPGLSFGLTGAVMLWGSRVGKVRLRDRVLSGVAIEPSEILDIGCGHGLMLIGAAKKFLKARAVGLDLWSGIDQAGNSREATLRNLQIEGVQDRVELVDGDARELPFEDDRFDLILSSFAIYNIHDAAGRKKSDLGSGSRAETRRPA